MKVLHVYSGNLYGGIETLLVTLARHRAVCSDMVPHFALCFEGRLSSELTSAGVPVYPLGPVRVSRPHSLRRARWKLRNLLQQKRFDSVVCHSAWSQAIFGPVVRAAGTRLAFYLHDVARGRHWTERWAKRTSPDLAICNSRFTSTSVAAIYPDIVPQIVHCAVPPPQGTPSRADRAAIRSTLMTAEDDVVVVQVSRLEEWKGHRSCFEALALIKHVTGWTCWQVGVPQRPKERRYLAGLKQLANELGIDRRVRFISEGSDVARLLSGSDIFCQPNIRPEPFGIAFVEALYAGLPVVTMAHGGAAEIVDTSCGVLLEPGDVAGLARALRCLIADSTLRAQYGVRAVERASAIANPLVQMGLLKRSLQRVDDVGTSS